MFDWRFFAGVYIVYMIIGASIFSAIESPQERDMVKDLKDQRNQFFLDHKNCMTEAQLEAFIVKIVQATNHGISAVRNVTSSNPNWSFGQSIFFASTVITTIGYGRVTPLSEVGKGFCILFTLIGIPMTLVLFSALVERLMIPITWFQQWLISKLGHLYKLFHIKLFHVAIVAIVLVVFFLLIPSAIYSSLETKWNYLDSLYYCFISLTTVGLGDFIPGDSPDQALRPLYKVATTCYLLIGLIAMMVFLTTVYEIPELNLGFFLFLKSDDDPERMRLTKASGDLDSSQRYVQHTNEDSYGAGSRGVYGDGNYDGVPSFPRPQTTKTEAADSH